MALEPWLVYGDFVLHVQRRGRALALFGREWGRWV